jgi:hypothetical protein
VLIGMSGSALAQVAVRVPEPTSLSLLAIGIGGAAVANLLNGSKRAHWLLCRGVEPRELDPPGAEWRGRKAPSPRLGGSCHRNGASIS